MVYNDGMEAKIDTHTHTIASGHYTEDTVVQMAIRASMIGLEHLCITEHGPAMTGSASESYFRNLKFGDKKKFGVKLYYGAELNVLDVKGNVDLDYDITKNLDLCIASLHRQTFRPRTERENTLALINAMDNPDVFIIGHPDNPDFEVERYMLVEAAKEKGCAIELNAASLSPSGHRTSSFDWLFKTFILCKKKGVYVTLGSDSHGRSRIADFEECYNFLDEIDFPEELVLNFDVKKLFHLIAEKKRFRCPKPSSPIPF